MNDNCCLVEYKCRVVYEYCVVDDKCYIVDDIFSVVDDKCCVIDEESCVVDDKCCVVDEEVCAASCVRVRSSGNQGVVHCFAYKYIIVYQFINLLSSFCLQGVKNVGRRGQKNFARGVMKFFVRITKLSGI